MEMEKDENWEEKFQPHLTSFTTSKSDKTDNTVGRPESDSMNDNTIKSKTNNSNDIPRANV